ncbi:MAG: hypothetical protein DI582_00735 [Azospirillum brasilense]|nr:MAG: hypothetical protein DI582_00735 [Azospirillum brasilense]
MSDATTPTPKNPVWEATKAAVKETAVWTVGWSLAETAVRTVVLKTPLAAAAKAVFSPSNLKWDIAIFGACSALFTAPKAYKAAEQANQLAAKAEAGTPAGVPHAAPVMTRSFAEKLEQQRSAEQGAAAELAR